MRNFAVGFTVTIGNEAVRPPFIVGELDSVDVKATSDKDAIEQAKNKLSVVYGVEGKDFAVLA